jgi:putative (di)nucleoside polyphosphate hydrolase
MMVTNTAKPGAEYRPGVGMMLLNSRDHVLMCRRADVANAWQMPQGGIDQGEEPRRAALRELKEEIGTDNVEILAESKNWYQYDLPAELIGKAWEGRFVGQRHKWFLMRFKGHDDEINVESKHAEFTGWIWVPPDHIADLVVPFKRDSYLGVLAEFRDLIHQPPSDATQQP